MATNFGFYPTTSGAHYFISYNTEDTERVKPIAYTLYKSGVPLWYDFGLEYGEEWERQIAANICSAKAVIMFITSGIFRKERSYVRKEFDIARMYNIKIVPVILDSIKTSSVPTQYAGWWVDVAALQGVTDSGYNSAVLSQQIMHALGYNVKPAAQQAAPQQVRLPSNLSVGSKVQFGRYPQNYNNPEPIKWRVLDIIDGKALMISEDLLEHRRFDAYKNDWQNSELRAWLNSDFLNKAFNAYEQQQMGNINGDRVTCLSENEVEKYFSDTEQKLPIKLFFIHTTSEGVPDRMAKPTAYARKPNSLIDTDWGTGGWWLRSPNLYVNTGGHIFNVDCNDTRFVRPVILASL